MDMDGVRQARADRISEVGSVLGDLEDPGRGLVGPSSQRVQNSVIHPRGNESEALGIRAQGAGDRLNSLINLMEDVHSDNAFFQLTQPGFGEAVIRGGEVLVNHQEDGSLEPPPQLRATGEERPSLIPSLAHTGGGTGGGQADGDLQLGGAPSVLAPLGMGRLLEASLCPLSSWHWWFQSLKEIMWGLTCRGVHQH